MQYAYIVVLLSAQRPVQENPWRSPQPWQRCLLSLSASGKLTQTGIQCGLRSGPIPTLFVACAEYCTPFALYDVIKGTKNLFDCKVICAWQCKCWGVFANSGPGGIFHGMNRHDLANTQWERLQPLLPPQKPYTGRPAADHRRILNDMRLCSLRALSFCPTRRSGRSKA